MASLLSTPATPVLAIKVTPVSVSPLTFLPLVPLLPLLASSTPASTPLLASFSGYCCEVAATVPEATSLMPSQPPSTDTMITLLSLPAFFSALQAPAAAGPLMVWSTLMV